MAALRVLIAGAGPAGLEAALTLRELAGERVVMLLLAPDEDLVYRPLSVADPFALAGTRRYPLAGIAEELGIDRKIDTLASVDTKRHVVRTGGGDRLEYDALLLALGARPQPAFEHALTFWGPGDAEALHGLVQDLEGRYVRRIAFVAPTGTTWPLPLYELALLTAGRAFASSLSPELHLVTPEAAPLEVFGTQAGAAVAELLRAGGIQLHPRADPAIPRQGVVEVAPGAEALEVDRVVALPWLAGRPIEGLHTDAAGFLPVDRHGRVRAVQDVWAAGDLTDYPLKQGGIATQQADAAAESIAACAGAPIEPAPFEPVLRGMLLTGEAARWLERDPAGDEAGVIASHALWWPPSKIVGRRLSPFLARRDEHPPERPGGTPVEVRLAGNGGSL